MTEKCHKRAYNANKVEQSIKNILTRYNIGIIICVGQLYL